MNIPFAIALPLFRLSGAIGSIPRYLPVAWDANRGHKHGIPLHEWTWKHFTTAYTIVWIAYWLEDYTINHCPKLAAIAYAE